MMPTIVVSGDPRPGQAMTFVVSGLTGPSDDIGAEIDGATAQYDAKWDPKTKTLRVTVETSPADLLVCVAVRDSATGVIVRGSGLLG